VAWAAASSSESTGTTSTVLCLGWKSTGSGERTTSPRPS
jgi:hypothetical protein